MSETHGLPTKWLSFVKSILETCGFGDIWYSHQFPNVFYLGEIVKQRLQDQFIQFWRSEIWNSSKCTTYRCFKTDFEFENYLRFLPPALRIEFCRYRCSNHRLDIELGRYQGIPRNQRLCSKCQTGVVGDEFHHLMECTIYRDLRSQYIPARFTERPNMLKLGNLFNSSSKTITSLCKFIKYAK